MREILFRGKRIDSGEWVEGNLSVYEFANGKVAHIGSDVVDPETVGQYTGLTDRNGTKIFEGDIVKVAAWHTVVFENGAFALKAYNKCHAAPLLGHINFESVMRDIEVIGNIHDNPELLKDAKGNATD